MALKNLFFGKMTVNTVKQDIKRRKIWGLIAMVSLVVMTVIFILLVTLSMQRKARNYYDTLANSRIQNSSEMIKTGLNERISKGFEEAKDFQYYLETKSITTIDSTLYRGIEFFQEIHDLTDVGVISNGRLYINDTYQEFPITDYSNEIIYSDDTNVYFLVPSPNTGDISAVVGITTEEKLLDGLSFNIYKDEVSYTIISKTGKNILVSSKQHKDNISRNTIDDFKKGYSEEEYNLFIENFNATGSRLFTLHYDKTELVFYKTELGFSDENGSLVFLLFVPKEILTKQLIQLNNIAITSFVAALILSSLIILTLFFFLLRSNVLSKLHNSYEQKTGLLYEDAFFRNAKALFYQNKTEYAMICMNIVGFKKINTLYGTVFADHLLSIVSDVLKEYVLEKNGDTIGYQNADNYLLFLQGNKEEVLYKLDSLNKTLIAYEYPSNISLQFSYGIKMIPLTNSENLHYDYDCAKFAEKHGSEDEFSFYDDEVTKRQEELEGLVNRFDEALEKHEFEVYLQLKWDISKNDWGGAEALVRWKDPVKGLISPGKFIPLFEENGYITRLDQYVFEETCRLMSSMLDNGERCVPVSVNLSKRNFVDLSFYPIYEEIVAKYKIPHELIEFEITEGLVVENVSSYREFIKILHDGGYSISMDDFGAGYSSLNMIHQLDFDKIKIDAKFFRAGFDETNRIIVSTIVSLCHQLGKNVVAEGVEQSFEVEFLRNIQCDYIQGYYYAKPLPFKDFRNLLLGLQD